MAGRNLIAGVHTWLPSPQASSVRILFPEHCSIKPGERFGLLVAIGPEFMIKVRRCIVMKCDCGAACCIESHNLFSSTQSCGCMKRERISHLNRSHGDSSHKLYDVRFAAIRRCHCQKDTAYSHYGARGISVCDEWRRSFVAFRDWALANGWKDGLSLDRIDNDGPYSPENCRFVTHKQNCNNRRSTNIISAFGEAKSIRQWAEDDRCVVSYSTLNQRIVAGTPPEIAITTAKGKLR